MIKKIIIIIVIVLLILAGVYFFLAKYMHYTIDKDIDVSNLEVTNTFMNNKAIDMTDHSKRVIIDAVSSATFKREFSEISLDMETYVIELKNSSNNQKVMFKFDLKGRGQVINAKKGSKVPIEVKKKLIKQLKAIFIRNADNIPK